MIPGEGMRNGSAIAAFIASSGSVSTAAETPNSANSGAASQASTPSM
ncbi:MAG TPA: hypothetical protein VFK57_09020 [Vicinamibacterales bacterium]|nr:hypothetical protein [Vicinamibacterales bacterium]